MMFNKSLLTKYMLCLYFVTGDEGHYKSFEEIYGTETTEEHLPGKKQQTEQQTKKAVGHEVPFSPSAQSAK